MKRISLSFIFILIFSVFIKAQNFNLTGQIIDASTGLGLPGVNIILSYKTDNIKLLGAVTDNNGYFKFLSLSPQMYVFKASFLGYKEINFKVSITNKDRNLGVLKMEQTSIQTNLVTIKDKEVRAEQKGDTTEYNSNAYKTNKDATTEDLVTKLPGVTVDNGTVKAHGETVQKVLIDGKEIFGDDPTIALRNMPASVVDKIQVFDKLSDQSQFTGFDDGNSQKTMNIITKAGQKKLTFGKIYAGYGTDDRYIGGGSLNFFDGDRRITIIGLTNDINQQNFSSQDLLGISSGSGMGGGGGYFSTGRSGRGRTGSGISGGLGSGASNFLVGQQGGINTTNSFGLNYIDTWAKKVTLSFSYFYNNTNNETKSSMNRQYILSDTTNQIYNEGDTLTSRNYNNRFSLRLQYDIDSFNSVIIQPRLNFQNYHSESNIFGDNLTPNNSILSNTRSDNITDMSGASFSNSLLFRHKFYKAGRTISLNIGTSYNDKKSVNYLYSANKFPAISDSSSILNQRANAPSNSYTLSADLNYTEPIGKNSIIQWNYDPSYSKNKSEKITSQYDTIKKEYLDTILSLSNNFDNYVITQRTGLSYRLRGEKYNFSMGLNYQNTEVKSNELFPYADSIHIDKTFNNILPSVNFQYKFSKLSNLRIFYRASTSTPGISQLQNVVNNTNPLFLSTGNPELKEQYSNSLVLRYGLTKADKANMFFAFVSASYTHNYIGNSTYIAQKDSTLKGGILLHQGSQLTIPVNLEGSWNINSFLTYGMALNFLKSNLNLNAGLNYSTTPALVNNLNNKSISYTPSGGFVLGSNISEKLDFTITYMANYNVAKNSLQPNTDINYFYHTGTIKFNWLPWKGLLINTDLNQTLYSGLGKAYDKNIFLWNAALGYKFLKNNAAEIKISLYDILNQNNSISRTVNDTYIETDNVQVLKHFYMITLTYNIGKYGNPNTPPQNMRPHF